jgi:hypothetical protein
MAKAPPGGWMQFKRVINQTVKATATAADTTGSAMNRMLTKPAKVATA